MSKAKKLKIEKYASDREQFVSVLRGVPIEHLDCVRSRVKDIATMVEAATSSELAVRVVFRGPRTWNPLSTLKEDARAFDVYVNTKNLPRRLSKKQREEIAESNRDEVLFTIRSSSESLSC